MRSLIEFSIFLAVIFFGVGEFLGGWFLGIPTHTPVMIYKKDTVSIQTRRTFSATQVPFALEGRLRDGSLLVQGTYERPTSFQNVNQRVIPERIVFEQEFSRGQRIYLRDVMNEGQGVYRILLTFRDATGNFSLELPNNSDL